MSIPEEIHQGRRHIEGSSLFIEIVDELRSQIKEWTAIKRRSDWMDIKEACKYASVSDSTLRRAIAKGELKVSKATGKLLFKIDWVDRWLNG